MQELGGRRVRLGVRPAHEPLLHVVREDGLEIGADVLGTGADENDVHTAHAAHASVEGLRDALQVPVDECLDVPLVPRLRPAALVVPARRLFRPVGDLDEPAAAHSEDLAALASHEGDERAVAAANEPHERREVHLLVHANAVRHRLREVVRAPEVVGPRREDGRALRAVAVELVVEPAADALEIGLQPLAGVAAQLALARVHPSLGLREERVDPRLERRRRWDLARIEVEVETDRTTAPGAEAGQVTQ